MREHFMSPSAIFPVIFRDKDGARQVLLHQRQNTGYMDGKWDFAGSGHVDGGETAKMATVRECAEEIGITVNMADVEFVHLNHAVRTVGHTYYDIYFLINNFSGDPRIMEPDKCSGMDWFDVNNPPMDMIDIRWQALNNILTGVPYGEAHGWFG